MLGVGGVTEAGARHAGARRFPAPTLPLSLPLIGRVGGRDYPNRTFERKRSRGNARVKGGSGHEPCCLGLLGRFFLSYLGSTVVLSFYQWRAHTHMHRVGGQIWRALGELIIISVLLAEYTLFEAAF